MYYQGTDRKSFFSNKLEQWQASHQEEIVEMVFFTPQVGRN